MHETHKASSFSIRITNRTMGDIMKNRKTLAATSMMACLGMACAASVSAGTYVYVSNQHDADISAYELVMADAPYLKPIHNAGAAKLVMPMAASPDGKFLYAAARAKPFALYSYRINPKTGELQWINTIPMPDSMVSIGVDQTGQWLLGASYGGDTISAHKLGETGIPEPDARQFFNSGGSRPHSIKTDLSNNTVYVPHLGTDEIRSYAFDAGKDKPVAEQATAISTEKGFGPRHFAVAPGNKFVYVLSELTGKVNVYERKENGELLEIQSLSSLPNDTKLVPGQPRVPVGTPGAVPFDETIAVWCADIQMTPNGRFLYTSERTGSTLSQFAVDAQTGKLRYLGQVPTEEGPRGFAIDPGGKFVVASGEKSPTVSLYSIDQDSGLLTHLGKSPVGKGANWVTIVKTD